MRVQLIGGFLVSVSGSKVKLTHRAQELLVWLALHPDEKYRRWELEEKLMDGGLRDPGATLRRTLFDLRHAIEAAGVSAWECVTEEDGLLSLGPCVLVDLAEERARWKTACRLADPRELVGAYRPSDASSIPIALATFKWKWADDAVEAIEGERRCYLLAVARAAYQIGSWDECAAIARRVLASDPLSEEAAFIAIRCELRLDNLGGASDLYRRLECSLDNELGALPTLSLEKLLKSANPAEQKAEAPRPMPPLSQPQSRKKSISRGVFLFAAFLIVFFSFGTMVRRSQKPTWTEEEALQEIAIGRRDPSSPDAQHARAQACAWIAENAYTDLFGPNESHWIDLIGQTSSDFDEAFAWGLSHEPETALRIIGNGHRYFAIVSRDDKWKSMLDQAIAVGSKSRSTAYGRTLIGIAYAHWKDGRKRGFASAARAAELFKLDSPRDYGVALRHMGLCCDGDHEDLRRQLYHRAMDVLRRADDEEGVAMCLQSLSEAWYDVKDPKDAREGLEWSLKAVDAFRSLRNERLVRYQMVYVDRFLSWLPNTRETRSLRSEAHQSLVSEAATCSAVGDPDGARMNLCGATKAAVALSDGDLIQKDLELFLATGDGAHRNSDPEYMIGGYWALRRRLHRLSASELQRAKEKLTEPELKRFEAGWSASLQELSMAMARELSPPN